MLYNVQYGGGGRTKQAASRAARPRLIDIVRTGQQWEDLMSLKSLIPIVCALER